MTKLHFFIFFSKKVENQKKCSIFVAPKSIIEWLELNIVGLKSRSRNTGG